MRQVADAASPVHSRPLRARAHDAFRAAWCAALLLAAADAYADTYKCQGEERIVRRDRHCLPGEQELEVTRSRDLYPQRPPRLLRTPPQADPSQADPHLVPRNVSTAAPAAPAGSFNAALPAPAAGDPPAPPLILLNVTPLTLEQRLQSMSAYSNFCLAGDFNNPKCAEFRIWSGLAAIALAILVALGVLLYLGRLQETHNARRRRVALEGVVADAAANPHHAAEGAAGRKAT